MNYTKFYIIEHVIIVGAVILNYVFEPIVSWKHPALKLITKKYGKKGIVMTKIVRLFAFVLLMLPSIAVSILWDYLFG